MNDSCHLLFIQCEDCKSALENCCSTACLEITHLPLAEQGNLRRRLQVQKDVFRKGKSENLKFKHSGNLSNKSLGIVAQTKTIRQKIKIKKYF